MSNSSPFALRLSAAASWVRCYAYPGMNARPEAAALEMEGDHTVREEGTAMHWAAHRIGTAQAVQVGDTAPNGIVIDDELLDGALFYLDVLDSHVDVVWTLETQLPAPSIHPKCGGTPDAFAVDHRADGPNPHTRPIVRVVDLKGGYVPVEVFPNYQLFGYASAVIDHVGLTGVECDVELTIVQPRQFHRDGPMRTFRTTSSQLAPYWEEMRIAAAVAMGDHARAVAGRQCDNCAAAAFCEVSLAAGARALEVSGEPNIVSLPPQAVDYMLMRLEDARDTINAQLTALNALGTHMSRNGQQLTHYAMQAGKGRLQWQSPEAERHAIALADLMGKNLRKPERAMTPTQAAKLLDPELLRDYTHRPRGEMKLVRFDANAATKAFSHLGAK